MNEECSHGPSGHTQQGLAGMDRGQEWAGQASLCSTFSTLKAGVCRGKAWATAPGWDLYSDTPLGRLSTSSPSNGENISSCLRGLLGGLNEMDCDIKS